MYVQEMVLEGFKTYQSRTVIEGFDPQFNAITGENGSGKSNILDAIQFLLGSNSKQMLRFKTNIYELIYKEGHAGIVQASVTVTFVVFRKELKDAIAQFVPAKQFDRLVVTRQMTREKQKFFINGLTSKLNKVKQLFQSVQLNIQNPHFLIKQGQITHISKMRPHELLGMIQQTAGTSYYNHTKHSSQGLIKRKDEKLKAINDLLKTTIEPHLARQRIDRENYQLYKNGQFALQKARRQLRLYDLVAKSKRLEETCRMLEDSGQDRLIRQQTLQDQIAQCEQFERQLMQTRRQKQLLGGAGEDRASHKHYEKTVEIKNLASRVDKLSGQYGSKGESCFQIEQDLKTVNLKLKFAEEQLEQAKVEEEYFNSLNSASADEAAKAKQLHRARALRQTQERLASLRTKLDYLGKEKEQQKQLLTKYEQDLKIAKKEHEHAAAILRDMEQSPVEKPAEVSGGEQFAQQERRLSSQLQSLYSRNFKLKLNYKMPGGGFDQKKVYGKVMMLFRVSQKAHMRAIQIGAGGRLNNIVVEDQHTSAALLEGRAFSYAVSILPERKMTPRPLSEQILDSARQIANGLRGFAQCAVNLIQFEHRVARSMGVIFGGWLVCSSEQIARRIAFNPDFKLRARCVTFQGEVIDPSGTMSGGYRSLGDFILPLCQEVIVLGSQLSRVQSERSKADACSKEIKSKHEQYIKYTYELQSLKAKCERFKETLNRGAPNKKQLATLEVQLQALKEQAVTEEQTLAQYKNNDSASEARQFAAAKRLRIQTEVSKLMREQEQLTKDVVKVSNYLQNIKKQLDSGQDNLQKLKQELEVLGREVQKEAKRQAQFNRKGKALLQAEKQGEEYLSKSKARVEELRQELRERQGFLAKQKKEISALQADIANLQKDSSLVEQRNRLSEQQFKAIAAMNADAERQKSNQLERQQQILKKKVNLNTEATEGKLEQQFSELVAKRKTLEQDRRLLLGNIQQLDEKRKQTLDGCFLKVRQNLKNIFQDMLPGASARLLLVDQSDVTKGCQLAVELHGVRKTLGELSGGQRSLLALSYLLALLLYKPAPFYILDEIDSALDLSHTENIGHMIRNRFGQSQFLLISLKEGMFQNSKVLFRVTFQDGQSKVERQQLKKNSK